MNKDMSLTQDFSEAARVLRVEEICIENYDSQQSIFHKDCGFTLLTSS